MGNWEIFIIVVLVLGAILVIGNSQETIKWDHSNLTYSFENKSSCGKCEISDVSRAFYIIKNQTGLFNFEEIEEGNEDADFLIFCNNSIPKRKKDIPAGLASINKSGSTINSVKIIFYGINPPPSSGVLFGCSDDFPIVEIHEVLHGLGLVEHSNNPKSVFYNVDSGPLYGEEIDEIDEEIVERIVEIYG